VVNATTLTTYATTATKGEAMTRTVFYVDHTWKQVNKYYWTWECQGCGELSERAAVSGGWIYARREPGDNRAQQCVVIENDWRE